MAVPTLNNTTSTTGASGTSLVGNAPTSLAPGDILVAAIYSQSGTSYVAPTPVTGPLWTAVQNASNFGVFFKMVTTNEPATYTFTWTSSSAAVLLITLIKGVTGPYGYDTFGSSINASSGNILAPALTTSRNATSLLLNIYVSKTATAITVPGGQTDSGSINANTMAAVFGWENLAATGSTGTRTATGGTAVNAGGSIAFPAPYENLVLTNTQFVNGQENRVYTVSNFPAAFPSMMITNPNVVDGKENRVYTVPSWITGVSGTLGTKYEPTPIARRIPFWLADTGIGPNSGGAGSSTSTQLTLAETQVEGAAGNLLTIDVTGTIAGIVTINGVPQNNVFVGLYYRPTGVMIMSTRTDSSGAYSFTGLEVGQAKYFVIAESPDSSTYNSMVFDVPLPT